MISIYYYIVIIIIIYCFSLLLLLLVTIVIMIIMVIIIIITMINRMIPYGYNPNSLRWGEIQATHQVPHGPPIPPVFQIRREHHGHQQDAFTVAVPRSTVRKTTW